MQTTHFLQKAAPLTFRRFSRKGYALHACLGREVRIGVLTAAMLATAAPALEARNMAEADTLRPTEAADAGSLDEAVVQASRAPLQAAVAARLVTTLQRQDLAAAGVTTLNDVLKLAAGVDVRQRGAFGMQTDISIDGGTFDQMALLINGISVTNPQTGHNAADFPIDIADIERVEVLRGAASRLYGSQAFSGAVNIVTRRGGSPLEVNLQGGSYGTALASARTALRLAPTFTTTLSAGYRRSDGAVENSAFEGWKAYLTGHYADASFTLDAQAGVTANDFGANTFYSAAYPNQWEATRRYIVAVKAQTNGTVHVQPQASWIRSTDHFQLVHHSDFGENFHRTDVATAGVNAWTDWCLGRTAIGTEMRQEEIYSTNLGYPLDESQQFAIPGADGRQYTRHAERTNVSYFAEHNVVAGGWTLSAGVMAQRNSATSRRFGFYPGVDISFRPGGGWRLFASWNRSMRLPSFTDLWYKSPTQQGNVGLRPEKCSAFRLGTAWGTTGVQMEAQVHYERCTDMIDWVMYAADDIYHATAFRADRVGASLTARLDFDALWQTRTPLRQLRIDYAWLCQHRLAGEAYYKSNYAQEYLRHKLTAALTHRLPGHLTATWTLRLQNREGGYVRYAGGQNTGRLVPYGTYALLDGRIAWEQPKYTLFVEGTNLTAKRYYDLGNVRQPGFMLMGGVRLSL